MNGLGLLKFPDWNNSREREFPGIPKKIPGNSRECQNYYKNTLKPIIFKHRSRFLMNYCPFMLQSEVHLKAKIYFEKFQNFRKILVKSHFYYYGKFPGVPGNSKNFPGIYFYGNSRELNPSLDLAFLSSIHKNCWVS